MSVSGYITDFEPRIHQLPTGVLDLTTGFLPEGLIIQEIINYFKILNGIENITENYFNLMDYPKRASGLFNFSHYSQRFLRGGFFWAMGNFGNGKTGNVALKFQTKPLFKPFSLVDRDNLSNL